MLDVDYFRRMGEKLGGQISILNKPIYGYADDEFNIASPQQLAVVLFEKLGLAPLGKKGKKWLLFYSGRCARKSQAVAPDY